MVRSIETDSIVADVGKACAQARLVSNRQNPNARDIPLTIMVHLARSPPRRSTVPFPDITVIPRPRPRQQGDHGELGAEAGQTRPLTTERPPSSDPMDCRTQSLARDDTPNPWVFQRREPVTKPRSGFVSSRSVAATVLKSLTVKFLQFECCSFRGHRPENPCVTT